LYPKSNIMSTQEIVSMELENEIKKIVSDKLENFIFVCVEDCQDTLLEDVELVRGFEHGILPPRYIELRKELEEIIVKYIKDTTLVESLT
jgi:hypothetical protein